MLQKCTTVHTKTYSNSLCMTPTHPLTLSLTHSGLIGSRPSLTSSHAQTESSPWQQGLAHYPQQGSALFESKRTWLTSQQTLSPCCHGNHNLATATWQRPTPRGIDWVSNAVRGGLGGVLLSPSVQRDTRGLSFARHWEDGGLTETVMTTLALNLTQRWKITSHLSITH